LAVVEFYVVGGEGLELVLELVFEERAEEDFFVFFVVGEDVGGGEELMGEGEEPGLFGVGGEFVGEGLYLCFGGGFLTGLDELVEFG
jgi:hypothetical protein